MFDTVFRNGRGKVGGKKVNVVFKFLMVNRARVANNSCHLVCVAFLRKLNEPRYRDCPWTSSGPIRVSEIDFLARFTAAGKFPLILRWSKTWLVRVGRQSKSSFLTRERTFLPDRLDEKQFVERGEQEGSFRTNVEQKLSHFEGLRPNKSKLRLQGLPLTRGIC